MFDLFAIRVDLKQVILSETHAELWQLDWFYGLN